MLIEQFLDKWRRDQEIVSARFDMEKFTEKCDFGLWKVKMKAFSIATRVELIEQFLDTHICGHPWLWFMNCIYSLVREHMVEVNTFQLLFLCKTLFVQWPPRAGQLSRTETPRR